jgi:hypothetical protein
MFNVDEYVRYKGKDKKLSKNRTYLIRDIRRGIDGAYDWDDIFLEGVDGKFSEFDFEYPPQNQDHICKECGRWVFKAKDKI